ncbi:MAG: response regulator [Anaerolineae bacterium]|nr:response regulator [Anaerolineae bacterium]
MARILVVDDDINLLQMLRVMLERVGHEVETANTGERGIAAAAESQPDLAIIDVMMPELSGYDVVRKLRADPSTAHIPIMILTARSQPVDKQMALDAGANSFMSKPVMAKDLTERVAAVIEAGVNFRVHTGPLVEPRPSEEATQPVTPPEGVTSAQPAAASAAPAAAPEKPEPPPPLIPGHKPIGVDDLERPADIPPARLPVITLLSLRGGTGCTTVAVNLAALLAQVGRQVCVADFSTAGGHVQMHLHFSVKQSWGNLVPMGDIPDPRALHEIVFRHPGTQVDVFPAPPIPTPDTLSNAAAQNVLRELATRHNPVIVDSGHLDAATVGALQVTGLVVVVMDDDPPSVQTTGQTLIALNHMGIKAAHVRVVLNHTRPATAVSTPTIQKALKRPVTAELPYDPTHSLAIRRGVPLVVAKPDSAYSQAIQQMARTLSL